MTKIGRNNPCPCGSGRKHKACCGAAASGSDFQFRLYDRLHGELIPRLMQFVEDNFGPEFMVEAWGDFTGTETLEPFHPEGPIGRLFIPWLLFNWSPELDGDPEFSGITAAELFFFADKGQLTTDQKEFLLSSVRCPYTLCEVVEVKPGFSLKLFDLLRRIEYEVIERSASRTIKKGEIVYCATSELRGFRANVGTGPYTLRPTSKLDILELRGWMVNEAETERITSLHLLEFEDDIRWLYLDLAAAALAPPVLVNYDGHRLLPQKLYFDIDSADYAFHALKFLAEGEDKGSLLENAIVENGVVKSIKFPWLGGTKKGRKKLGGTLVLGSLTIKGKRLVIEVNSTERADAIRKIIEQRLPGHATYRTGMIEPIESQLREMGHGAGGPGGSPIGGGSPRVEQSGLPSPDEAEIRKIMDEIARKHWENWLDGPIPALDNLTPRKAAKTKRGRDLLESLLLEYESRASTAENPFKPDIKALRRTLGMD
jgi:hypothetical protein